MKIKDLLIRVIIWVSVITVTLSSSAIWKAITTPKPEIVVSADTTKYGLKNVQKISVKGYKTRFSSDNADLIIDKPNLEKDGYTEYNNAFYSPLVVIMPNRAFEANSGLVITDTSYSQSSRTATKNLRVILEAMEQDKTWEEFGFNKEITEGKVQLAIPDKYSNLRPYIKDLFILNLADEINENNILDLSLRADKIMEKCYQVEDIETYLRANFEKDGFGKIALIMPEYMISDYNSMFYVDVEETNSYFVPVYPTKTTAINYSLYFKDEITKELKTKLLETYSGKPLSKKIDFRTTYQDLKNKHLEFSRTISNIKVEYIPNDIKNW